MGEAGEVNKLLLGVGHYPAILPDNEAILTGRSLINELNFIYPSGCSLKMHKYV